jgi:AraC-like DNA-binding protein
VPSNIATLASTHIVDLVSHANGVLADGLSDQTKSPVLLSIMLDYIGRHSSEPGLSAATLAREFHCSERYVHKLFSRTGRSVGEHVNSRRIAFCARALFDNGQNQTIAEIAFAAGFRDISYFNRLFKRSNGIPPREYRRATALGDAPWRLTARRPSIAVGGPSNE